MRIIKVPHSGFNALTVTEFESSSTCDERIMCLNSQEVTVIRKALEPFYWPTRYGEFVSPGYFQIAPNEALLDVLREIDYKMGCNDLSDSIETLAVSLERGLLAIANRPCCDDNTQIIINSNGGVIGTTPSGQITYGTQDPIDPPSTYPEGYESQEQYEAQKCAIAHGIVTGVVFSFDALTAISGVNAIAATVGVILAAIPLIPVSPVLIPVLVPLVATAWLASGVLHAASLMVEANRQTLVCILVSGENISIIFEQLSDALDIMIASMSWSGPVALAVKSLIMVLLNADTLNQLYGVFAGFMYPEADCSDCDDVECPIALYFISDIATSDLATLSNCSWVDQTVSGTTGAWVDPVDFSLNSEELFALAGREFNTTGIRLRMTVYLPENANSEYDYGVNDESIYYASGSNGYGPQTYYIDWTTTLDEPFERVWFQGRSNVRQWVLSEIKVDIPCEAFPE